MKRLLRSLKILAISAALFQSATSLTMPMSQEAKDLQNGRMTGYLFSIGNRDYISEMPLSSSPKYQLTWKKGKRPESLCFSIQHSECPQYIVRFQKILSAKNLILSESEIVDPFDDPVGIFRSLDANR